MTAATPRGAISARLLPSLSCLTISFGRRPNALNKWSALMAIVSGVIHTPCTAHETVLSVKTDAVFRTGRHRAARTFQHAGWNDHGIASINTAPYEDGHSIFKWRLRLRVLVKGCKTSR